MTQKHKNTYTNTQKTQHTHKTHTKHTQTQKHKIHNIIFFVHKNRLWKSFIFQTTKRSGMPDHLCVECCAYVKKFIRFQQKCHRAHYTLEQMLGSNMEVQSIHFICLNLLLKYNFEDPLNPVTSRIRDWWHCNDRWMSVDGGNSRLIFIAIPMSSS